MGSDRLIPADDGASAVRDPKTVTRLLRRAEAGDRPALDALFEVVYEELHLLARRQRRRWRGDPTLGTTALVHEAYVKLAGQQRLGAPSRAHFFAIASRAMRHILSNYAKARRRKKRGGDAPIVSLDDVTTGVLAANPDPWAERAEILAAIDEALVLLEERSERQCRVVECRLFGGLSIPETAEALQISPATVKRDWAFAQAWLHRQLRGHAA